MEGLEQWQTWRYDLLVLMGFDVVLAMGAGNSLSASRNTIVQVDELWAGGREEWDGCGYELGSSVR